MWKIIIAALLVSCTTVAPTVPETVPPVVEEPEPAPPPYHPPPVEYKAAWSNPEFTKFTAKALNELGSDLLKATPKDLAEYCPPEGDRKQCYIGIISGLAKFESNFKPTTNYTESFKDAKGKFVISRGLLQISQESANGYGCGISKPEMLLDAETNLRCGVRIMNRWIVRDGVIAGGKTGAWKGNARYWSPFRKADRISSIKAMTKKLFN